MHLTTEWAWAEVHAHPESALLCSLGSQWTSQSWRPVPRKLVQAQAIQERRAPNSITQSQPFPSDFAVTVNLLLLTLKTRNAFFGIDIVLPSLPCLGSLYVFQYLSWKTSDVILWWCNAYLFRLLGGRREERATKEQESIHFRTKPWLNQRSMSFPLLTGSQKNSVGKVRESSNSKTSSEYVGGRRIPWRCSWWLCTLSH